ncbi:MAG: type II secretion system secretin GspD [Myxococcota bacterium]|nr:type II secretion system secretin GspD [Myxococcota bacterium]
MERSAIKKKLKPSKKSKKESSSKTSRSVTSKGASDSAASSSQSRGANKKGNTKSSRASDAEASGNKSGVTTVAPKTQNIDFQARKKKGKFTFEFNKAEIIDVVKAISDMMQRNFIIPEKLKSQRITILSPQQITANEAYQVFLAALASNNITIVKIGKFYKLVEAKNSIREPIPTCVTPDDECPSYQARMITVLLGLKYIDGAQINSVLKSLISKEGELTFYQPTNSLIVSEYATNLTRLRKIIDALDVPGFQDELQIVQIEYSTASEIADKLTQIFEVKRGSKKSGSKGKSKRPSAKGPDLSDSGDEGEVHISKIIPDDRTNQIIIKANKRSFEAIRSLIAKLDIPISDSEQGRIHVYYLENASAEDLSSTLSSLAQGRSGGSSKKGSKSKAAQSAVLFEGEVQITAEKSTNALIIVASPHDFRALKRLIEKLDVPRRQVYVEAAILEVTVSDSDEFGLNWHSPMRFSKEDLGADLGGAGTVGFLQSAHGSGGLSPTIAALSSPAGLLGIAGGSIAGIVGKGIDIPVGDQTVSFPSFGVVLKWLQSSSSAKILSTPHILTTDNEQASIEVGTRIPFQRGTSIPGGLGGMASGAGGALGNLGSLGSLFSSTDRIDVSLKLSLTPQINERNRIRLEIDQQIEDLVGKEEVTGQPITANRSAKTVVVVDDQQTVVLGGLMRDRVRESESKIPLLGDLPLIGWFFKKRSSETEKVNLLLVLTPYIVRDSDDFQNIFERKLDEYETFAADYYGHKSQYRAHIDYRRKNGPLALLGRTVQKELGKIENGGTGGEFEIIIKPEAESQNEETSPPSESEDSESTETTDESS